LKINCKRKQTTGIYPGHPMFLFEKIKVVYMVFMNYTSWIKIILTGKQKAYFLNIIPDISREYPLAFKTLESSNNNPAEIGFKGAFPNSFFIEES